MGTTRQRRTGGFRILRRSKLQLCRQPLRKCLDPENSENLYRTRIFLPGVASLILLDESPVEFLDCTHELEGMRNALARAPKRILKIASPLCSGGAEERVLHNSRGSVAVPGDLRAICERGQRDQVLAARRSACERLELVSEFDPANNCRRIPRDG